MIYILHMFYLRPQQLPGYGLPAQVPSGFYVFLSRTWHSLVWIQALAPPESGFV